MNEQELDGRRVRVSDTHGYFSGCEIYFDVIRSTWPTLVALGAVVTVAVTTPAVCLHHAFIHS